MPVQGIMLCCDLRSTDISFQVCQHLDSLKARLSRDLVFVVWSVVVSWSLSGHPRPSLLGHRCTVGVLAGTHRCATESRVTVARHQPLCVLVGVVTSCVLCARFRVRVSRSCATENTYNLLHFCGGFLFHPFHNSKMTCRHLQE